MTTKTPKTKAVKVIQGRYTPAPYGWEDCSEYDRAEWTRVTAELKEYRRSAPAGMVYRVITRRVSI